MGFIVITHAYNEHDLLPQFVAHYERHGASEVRIIFDRRTEMDDAAHARERTAARHACNGLADYVLLPDVDEFIVPIGYKTILEALDDAGDDAREVYRCEGYGMVRRPEDPPYNPALPIVGQCTHGYRDAGYDKPIVLTPSYPYAHEPGFHAIDAPHVPGAPRLFALLHMVAFDEEISVRRKMNQTNRHGAINRARGFGRHNYDKTEADHRAWYHDVTTRTDLIQVITRSEPS
jgi:hypothetical protein